MKKNLLCVFLILAVAAGVFAGGGGQSNTAVNGKVSRSEFNPTTLARTRPPANFEISILTISFDGRLIAADHPAKMALEAHTGYKIRLEYVLNANYNEQINTRLAARDLPGLVALTGNSSPIAIAAQYGAFWDITDVYDLYPNLARADKNVMNNISINGRYYGIYRSREMARAGMVYRTDWLQNVGLSAPRTLDDLYNVLRAFTNNNPTGTGSSTYGMTWTGFYMGPFYDIAVMHGAPWRFGIQNGKLTPWFDYPEFMEAMDYSKRLYDEGLINRDFAALQTSQWALPIGSNQAGWHMDVADEASRTATRLRDNGFMTQADFDAGRYVSVMGSVANKNGQSYSRANNTGNQGYVAVSTTGARNLQELHYYLDFMDKCNDATGQNLLVHGAEGVNYRKNADGTITNIPAAEITPTAYSIMEGWNQFRMMDSLAATATLNPYQVRHTEVYAENRPIVVVDPTTPIAMNSTTWTSRQTTLNQIIDDAVINYIMGTIDRAGFQSEVRRWYAEDGQTALNELQAAYDASRR